GELTNRDCRERQLTDTIWVQDRRRELQLFGNPARLRISWGLHTRHPLSTRLQHRNTDVVGWENRDKLNSFL
ncbi:hypothetical protein GOODEAATRI_019684, partial [Goodea atripinnis]